MTDEQQRLQQQAVLLRFWFDENLRDRLASTIEFVSLVRLHNRCGVLAPFAVVSATQAAPRSRPIHVPRQRSPFTVADRETISQMPPAIAWTALAPRARVRVRVHAAVSLPRAAKTLHLRSFAIAERIAPAARANPHDLPSLLAFGNIYSSAYGPAGNALGKGLGTGVYVIGASPGIATLYGDRGTSMDCEHLVNNVSGKGAGACKSSTGAVFRVHF